MGELNMNIEEINIEVIRLGQIFVIVSLLAISYSQDINFSNKKKSSVKKTASKNNQDVKSKNFKGEDGLRAASNCLNCECQCDSYAWTNSKGQYIGNCQTPDSSGANFCYVSGRAKRACRDVQQSTYRRDSFNGQKKFYSYEACVTPKKNDCYRINQQNGYNGQNCGDGDYNNGGYPNNNGGYPNNNGGYPSNGNGGYPSNGNGGYPNNNQNNGYPGNSFGAPRSDKVKDSSITFGA